MIGFVEALVYYRGRLHSFQLRAASAGRDGAQSGLTPSISSGNIKQFKLRRSNRITFLFLVGILVHGRG
jgi:hypothetical protein